MCHCGVFGFLLNVASLLQGRNKSGQVGFFPESYVEVGPTASHSPPQITPGSSYTDGPIGGSPVSVASIGQATSASTKYCKFKFFLFLLFSHLRMPLT